MSSRAEVEPVSSTRSDPLNPEVEAQPLKQRMVPLHWHKVAAISGVAAVGLGAYGSHLFNPKNPVYKEVWQTASVYHLAHSVALLAAPITKRPNIFGGLLTAGVIAFSGSCYAAALLEDRKYSALAPFGGFAFMAAWASLLF
ncbi:transmembrane protein 256 homolog [Morus notabilis]|uniref:transmembrane protein 256 homolog n=1 Tax=Morus notabilis TaxID=981085 RepID=UPI000CECEDA3|nr:transmembrane protein 256 homolog [Morus notabilis]